MSVHGIVCGPRIYSFRGWEFEDHAYCGPWPLKHNGDPRKRMGRVFLRVYSAWCKLPPSKKQRSRIGGGCRRF